MTLPVPDLRDLDCGSLNWARFMVVGYCQIAVAIHGNLNTSRLYYLCSVELCLCHKSESCCNRQSVYSGVRSACPSSCFELNRSCFVLKLNPRTDTFIHMGRKRMQLTDGSVLSAVSIQAKALRDGSSLFLSRALYEHRAISSIYTHVVSCNSLSSLFLYLFLSLIKKTLSHLGTRANCWTTWPLRKSSRPPLVRRVTSRRRLAMLQLRRILRRRCRTMNRDSPRFRKIARSTPRKIRTCINQFRHMKGYTVGILTLSGLSRKRKNSFRR